MYIVIFRYWQIHAGRWHAGERMFQIKYFAPLLSIAYIPLAGAGMQLRWGAAQCKASDAMGVSNGLILATAVLMLGFRYHLIGF